MKRTTEDAHINVLEWQDGTLSPDERQIAADHLNTCRICQDRITLSREVGTLLRRHFPVVEDEAGKAALKARLRLVEQLPAAPMPSPARRLPARWVTAAGALILVILLLVGFAIAQPDTTVAGFRIGRVVAFVPRADGSGEQQLSEEAGPPGEPVATLSTEQSDLSGLSFSAVVPSELPFGLQLMAQVVEDGSYKAEYANAEGFRIRVEQEIAATARASVNPEDTRIVPIRGTEVIFLGTLLPGYVSHLIWEQDGVLMYVAVLTSREKPEGISDATATAIVEAFIAAR